MLPFLILIFITYERNYLFIDVAVMRYISCKRGTNAYNR